MPKMWKHFFIIILFVSFSLAQEYNFVWVVNSDWGNSISKINGSATSQEKFELARYYTVPSGVFGNPSRTAVDSEGNVWVGNRGTRTLVKIGLLEAGKCVDRNNNGRIDTSRDLNDNGLIDDNEILPFGEDECVLFEVNLGTGYPSLGAGGVRCVCIDEKDNVYAGIWVDQKVYYISKDGVVLKSWNVPFRPYGCIMDKDKTIWFVDVEWGVYRFYPQNETFVQVVSYGYTYTVAPSPNKDFVAVNRWASASLMKINTTTNTIVFDYYYSILYGGRGIVVDENNFIYAVSSLYNILAKFNENGELTNYVSTCYGPFGIDIDAQGYLWVTCYYNIQKYDKNLNLIFSSPDFGTMHYTYSDFTGYMRIAVAPPLPKPAGNVFYVMPDRVEKNICYPRLNRTSGIFYDIETISCGVANWGISNLDIAVYLGLFLALASLVFFLFKKPMT